MTTPALFCAACGAPAEEDRDPQGKPFLAPSCAHAVQLQEMTTAEAEKIATAYKTARRRPPAGKGCEL